MKIGNLELKNPMVVSAMVTNYCNPDGTTTEKYIVYHEHKARRGWGLIITENFNYVVTPTAGRFVQLPGLWGDRQIESHKELTRRVCETGGKSRRRFIMWEGKPAAPLSGRNIIWKNWTWKYS